MTDMQKMLVGMVRGLEWANDDWKFRIRAKTGVGDYVIWWKDHNAKKFTLGVGDYGAHVDFPTLEAAQSAAQADYTARILAALNPDAVLALVAAAYADGVRDAARRYDCGSGPDSWYYFATAKAAILDLLTFPTDATAALERMLADARAEGLEMAAVKATSFLVGDPKNDIPLRSPGPHEIASAIRAMKGEGE